MFVCLSVREFLSHQKSQHHDILAQGVIWAWLGDDEARFFIFSFLPILGAFFWGVFLRILIFTIINFVHDFLSDQKCQ